MPIHKKSLMGHMEKMKGGGLVLNAPSARIYVPIRYEIHDLFVQGDKTSFLGVCQIEVEGEKEPYNLVFPAMLDTQPSTILQVNREGIDYYVLVYQKGDVIVTTMEIIQQAFVLAKIFIEFFRNGKMPPWFSYDQMATILDLAQELSGQYLPVPHSVIEMMIAHCARDSKNPSIKYRHTAMKNLPLFLGLRDTTNVRDSTTSRLIGAYFLDGVNSSIVNQSEHRSEVEDLLRS